MIRVPGLPSEDRTDNYIKTRGSKGEATIRILLKNRKFIDAMNTEVGQALLEDICKLHEEAFGKIAALQASDEDKMEYKVLQRLIDRFATRITDYVMKCQMVEGARV